VAQIEPHKSVQILHSLRQELAGLQGNLAIAQDAFEQTVMTLRNRISELKEQIGFAEEVIEAQALDTYTKTQDKKPLPGVTVKIFKGLKYDEQKALAWAAEKKMCISLDKKAFEKVASAANLDFVEQIEEPRVQVSKDLAEALEPYRDQPMIPADLAATFEQTGLTPE
jgi:hypothetical protein